MSLDTVRHPSDRARRFYRSLLRLYPKWFQELYGRQMMDDFVELFETRGASRSFFVRASCWFILISDLVRSVPEQHRLSAAERRPYRQPTPRHTQGGWLMSLNQDLRYAFRTLRRAPLFSMIAILTLALGIGANSAMFSVVNGVILQPLGYQDPGDLAFITGAFPTMGFDKFWVSAPEYRDYQGLNRSFSVVGAYNTAEVSINGGETPIRVSGAMVTAEFFEALGVPARVGRVFTREEDVPGGNTMVLSYELWERAFGGSRDVIGSTLQVNGADRTILGVMPPKFDIDDNRVEAWIPQELDPANPRPRSNHFLYLVGRLNRGVTLERARAELGPMIAGWSETVGEDHALDPEFHYLNVDPLREEVIGEIRPALLVLLGAVGFVLLIACANVANLLLAKAESRQKEIAVRTALGAGRGRLMRQFLTESLLLSTAGGLAGLLLGSWGIKLLLATSAESIPRINEVGLDPWVLFFTLGVSLIAGVLFGLAPGLHLSIRNLAGALREGGQRTTAGAGRLLLRRGLVVSELALAVILVIGSGLMLRSFAAIQNVDPGFQEQGLLTFRIYLPPASYPGAVEEAAFLDRLQMQLAALPGVASASMMNGLPPRRRLNANSMEVEGYVPGPDEPGPTIDFWQFVTPNYFETMGIPLVEGRLFGPQDGEGSVPAVLVNESMAAMYWPDGNAIGGRLRAGNPWLNVVGIVRDVKQAGLEEEAGTELYFYYPQTATIGFAPRTMNVVLRTTVPPSSVAGAAREAVWGLDPQLPVADMQPMERVMYESVAQPRFLTWLLGIFGAVALLLAAGGTYGVMSYTVAERSHEMGVRMALGSKASDVIRLVLAQGLRVAFIGLAIGVAGAFALTKVMSSILFGVSTTDAMTFVVVPAILTAVAAIACLIPARRATKVDPITVLRAE